ncbi:DMT family transporter [Advenella mimigardefordensis]|uniref:Putative inner membrane transport protein n=1 Tax=Advenella mimigardefordensis (strain DSM 17166 / LMG 22922 / DPN7) TaxID=1247726 RepID=W0PBD8_ADVMD|nr:EamA family transporter [Advenella mimigardefordensis]AHG64051.1 putative inner membrane transport protein [Advenella mimigardefordensis DPN7]
MTSAHSVKPSLWWSWGAPIVFILLWSSGFSFGKIGLQYAEPLTLLSLRYACVVIALLPVQHILGLSWPATRREWSNICIVGLLIQFIYFSFSYVGMKQGVSAGTVALIVSLQPILVGICAPKLTGERQSLLQWLGLALGLIGAVIVITSGASLQAGSWFGLVLVVISLFALTAGVLYERISSSGVAGPHPVTTNIIQCAIGLVFCLPLALLMETNHIEFNWPFTGALAYLVLCNSIITISLLLAMVRRQQAARVSALFFLVPACASVVAMFMLGETMAPAGWIGMTVAIAGVLLASTSTATTKKSTANTLTANAQTPGRAPHGRSTR